MRAACDEVMTAAAAMQPMFSMEQEYAVLDPFTGLPPGTFPAGVPMYIPGAARADHGCCESGSAYGSPCTGSGSVLAASLRALPGGAAAAAHLLLQGQPQQPHGSPAARRARQLSEPHMRACIKAGLCYAGSSAVDGSCCDCWAYKIGPCAGVEMGDQLSVSRFLLKRLGEDLDVSVSFAAHGQVSFNGSGAGMARDWGSRCAGTVSALGACSVEFSTAATRSPTAEAMGEMQRMLSRLQLTHAAHATAAYSANFQVPSAAHQPFSVAVGDKRAAIMIPTSTLAARCGPFVDRRCASTCDPYLATCLLTAGALGLTLPASAIRVLSGRPAAAGASRPAPAPTAAAALASGASTLYTGEAAQLLLKQCQQQKGGFGGLCAALNAALAAGCLQTAHPQSTCARPSTGAGACSGSFDDDNDLVDSGSEGEASQDLLISEIRRIDRQACRARHHPAGAASSPMGIGCNVDDDADEDFDFEGDDFEGEEDDSASSAMASAASSPGCGGGALAAACASDDVDMLLA